MSRDNGDEESQKKLTNPWQPFTVRPLTTLDDTSNATPHPSIVPTHDRASVTETKDTSANTNIPAEDRRIPQGSSSSSASQSSLIIANSTVFGPNRSQPPMTMTRTRTLEDTVPGIPAFPADRTLVDHTRRDRADSDSSGSVSRFLVNSNNSIYHAVSDSAAMANSAFGSGPIGLEGSLTDAVLNP